MYFLAAMKRTRRNLELAEEWDRHCLKMSALRHEMAVDTITDVSISRIPWWISEKDKNWYFDSLHAHEAHPTSDQYYSHPHRVERPVWPYSRYWPVIKSNIILRGLAEPKDAARADFEDDLADLRAQEEEIINWADPKEVRAYCLKEGISLI